MEACEAMANINMKSAYTWKQENKVCELPRMLMSNLKKLK